MNAKFNVIITLMLAGVSISSGAYMNDVRDTKIFECIEREEQRQRDGINLIASENFASSQIMEIAGSVLTNKYTEGYPKRRYYSGCFVYDDIERIAIKRFKKLFGAEHANVQPHAGSQANAAVYLTVLDPGDTILSMDLACGGHLSHGHSMNWTSQIYNIVSYGVDRETLLLDYDAIEALAFKHKPKLIIAGASAYSQEIDFKRFAAIAKKVGALFMADIAHIAGLVAAGIHQSPFPEADIVTMTTHKTFRGPRGGVIMTNNKALGKKIDKMIIPGYQGGALMNHVAGKAAACLEAMDESFVVYQKQVVANARAMADRFEELGYKVLAGGTSNHLFLIDVMPTGLNGREVEKILESIGIYVNRNAIPYDTQPPLRPSGIRIGSPAMTTLGAQEQDVLQVVDIIDRAIKHHEDPAVLTQLAQEVIDLMGRLRK